MKTSADCAPHLPLLNLDGPHVRIVLSPKQSIVYVNDKPVGGLVSVRLTHHAGDVCKLVLEILPSSVEIEGCVGNLMVRGE